MTTVFLRGIFWIFTYNFDLGVAFVKFHKLSNAAAALEELDGKHIDGQTRTMKVMLASK